MPQPRAAAPPRGNSAMAQFKPKRWQVEDRCGICNSDFSLMNTRHHCRSCGLSVCGKHSRNKVIVPTSLSKVPQRVCDKCYPKCRNVAMGLAPPPRRDLPDDKPRRHTLESRDEREYGHRMRSPRDGARKTAEGARRDNRTWNGDDDYDEPRRIIRRDGEPRTVHSARDRRMRSPRAKSPHAARSPHGRDPREVVSTRGKNLRDRPSREGDLHPNDLFHDPRDKERRHRDPRERDPRDKERRQRDPRERERRRDPRERDPRERDLRERDPRERDPRERDPRKRDPRERDPRERERRDRDPRDRERRDRALHERDLFDGAPRGRSSRDSPAQKERRRIPSTDPTRNRKNEQMRSPAPSLGKHVSSGKVRRDTSSTCRTTSSTLSNLYAAINATEEIKDVAPPPKTKPKRPPPRKEETEKPSAFADSTFSIFSLAGSDHESSEAKARSNAPIKKRATRRPGASANSANRESMEKKEHLDFSASSSSVKSFEVSAITQKYLKPKPAKAAMQKTTLKPMIEEDSEEESARGPSRRRADPQAYTGERRRNKVRGETQNDRKMMSPFRRNRPDASFRDSSELMRGGNRKPQNSGATMSISDYDEFQETRVLLGDDNSISNDDDEAIAELLAASNRGKQDLTAKLRAKKKAIAGIDAASLEAKEKAPTTANYKLTAKDKELMRQISELEATVLQHQKELPDLIDMYSEAMKRSQKAQRELQKAKVRVARYEKAHAAVSRAIRTGKLYMKQKEYMAAILELSRATGIERSNATLWYLLAECRLKVGQPAAAEDACMTSLKLQPSGAAVAMLGRIMHERGRDDEAIECYLSALGRNDESEDEQDSICMDAFLQRQLFAQDVVFLATDSESAKARDLVKTHGGVVLSEDQKDAEDARVNVVLLPGQDQKDDVLQVLVSRFPKAEILRAQWAHDSVQKNRRLSTTSYRLLQPAKESTTTGTEPPAKKQRVATPTSPDFFSSSKPAAKSDASLPEPHFIPWKTIQNSLYVLDARAKEQQKEQTDTFKIAGFDLDGTLIATKSGKKFAKDKDDWKLFHPTLVKQKLTELASDGFTLTIFSNQNGIAKGHITAAQVQSKLEAIVKQLKLPMLVFLGTENDSMRKPRLGAWKEMVKLLSAKGEEAIDKRGSFYCGDAAGRPKITGRAKDFAATDYKFALNVGIRFFTPEDLFLGSKQRIHTRPDTWELGFDPKSIALSESTDPLLNPPFAHAAKSDQELVVLVGPPASGKSFFAKTHLSSYVIVSQDELRTAANCKKKCLEAIEQKKSVVIDNTNRDPRSRKEWIAIAKEKNLPVRCFEMNVDKPLSMHLNTFRSLTEQKKIPDVAIHGFYKNLVEPTINEGFVEVVKVQFRIDKNISEADQVLLRSYI